MKALGIGVRVWVGWCSPDKTDVPDASFQAGLITDGPHPPGKIFHKGTSEMASSNWVTWDVLLDDGRGVAAAEYLLTPIDDDAPDTVTQESEQDVCHG